MPATATFALDLRTLHLVILIVAMVSAGALSLTWRRHPAIPGVPDWTYGMALMALGGLGISLRDLIWDPLSVVGANVVLVAGHAYLWQGISRFRGVPVLPGQVLVPTLLTFVFQLTALILAPNWVLGRIVFISAMIGSLEALGAYALLCQASQTATIINRTLAALLLADALNNLTRIAITLLTPAPNHYLGPSIFQGAFILIALILGIAKVLGILTLISDRLQEELNRAATHDFLTQLPNRRAFSHQAQQEVSRIARGGTPATVLLLDLDHFKDLNDAYGHNAGDAALQAFGQLLSTCLRQHDQGCRYGGEEFCVLLPETPLAEGLAVAERIRAAAAAAARPGCGTTVSIGVALLGAGQRLEDVINRADQALYVAKRSGRNCIEVAPCAAPPTITLAQHSLS